MSNLSDELLLGEQLVLGPEEGLDEGGPGGGLGAGGHRGPGQEEQGQQQGGRLVAEEVEDMDEGERRRSLAPESCSFLRTTLDSTETSWHFL